MSVKKTRFKVNQVVFVLGSETYEKIACIDEGIVGDVEYQLVGQTCWYFENSFRKQTKSEKGD